MANREHDGVVLGPSRVDYQDGSEDEVLEVVRAVTDRSVDSPEWRDHIHDWPTRYHFSALRSNLLRPLHLGAGTRVLEIGCGTGPLTRHLGEQGAQVLAVDGSLSRARAASVRCSDLPDVRVMCGTIDDVGERDFDVVLVIGVLEYAGAAPQSDRPDDWLSACISKLAPGGALVLAIENQLGLKYLLGWDEDHHGLPWVGVRGYTDVTGARTWSRRELGALIARCGLPEQRWLYPFPDYKLPTTVLDQDIYRRADAEEVVDALVVRPTSDDAGAPHLTVDAREAHRTLVGAGLGEDVANSFLVVASAQEASVERLVDRSTMAWLSGDQRLEQWQRRRRLVRRGPDGLAIVTDRGAGERRRGWLTQVSEPERPFAIGVPLDRQLVSAFARPGTDAAAEVMRRWLAALPPEVAADAAEHPFAPGVGEAALAPEALDVKLSNFVQGDEGVTFIDDEWRPLGPVSRELVLWRGLWWTAKDLVDEVVAQPWGSDIGVADLAVELGRLAGIDLDPERLLPRFVDAEVELQVLVHDDDPDDVRRALEGMAELRPVDVAAATMPIESLVVTVGSQRDELDALRADLGALRERSAVADAEAERHITELRDQLHRTEQELEAMRSTRLFRWAAVPRRLYARVRRRS